MTLHVGGLPTGSRRWREQVAVAARGLRVGDGIVLAFTLPPGRFVDVDTLAETTLAGLRDAGAVPPRLAGLEALLATKRGGAAPGAGIAPRTAAAVRGRPVPGPVLLDTAAPLPTRGRDGTRGWRGHLAATWQTREPLGGNLWADLALPVAGSLTARVEVVLDALEPVLGRDPRGRPWQVNFPNDHLITWLRVTRAAAGEPLRLRLGNVE